MAIDLVPLCTADVTLAEPIVVSPELVIGEVLAARFEGERLTGSLKGRAAADWLRMSPEGFGTLDVRVTLETDDGALVYATYSGRLHLDTMTAYATPLFHTADERYRWLNRIQALSKGTFPSPTNLVYEIYEVR